MVPSFAPGFHSSTSLKSLDAAPLSVNVGVPTNAEYGNWYFCSVTL